MELITKYSDTIVTLLLSYGPKLVLALATFFVGWWFIGVLTKALENKLQNNRIVDQSLKSFLRTLINALLKTILVISVAGMIGVEMTSFIAVLGAAGLAIGMALSGTLQNFAGGIIILLFKPFKVGDFITAQGQSGTVHEIQIFNTILKSPDNKTIIIPNSPLSSGTMINFSTEATRRVEWTFGISYDDNIDQAKEIIKRLVTNDSRVLQEPALFIAVSELADSSVNFVVRAWTESANFWGVYFDIIEAVKKTFDAEGVSIPFPQRDVHMKQCTK